jgi:RNA polymerase sigma-70 factor, ECF subfamily
MCDPTDSELLQEALQGDASAFRMLVRRHDKYLYRIARSILRDDHDAEDIVQETFIRAFTGLRSFRGSATFRTWLTRIVLNESTSAPSAFHLSISTHYKSPKSAEDQAGHIH